MRKRIMRKFRINEISGVDVPAQEGARVLIMKRRGTNDPVDKSDVVQAITGSTNGHLHGIRIYQYSDGDLNLYVTHATAEEGEQAHDHLLFRSPDGTYTVLENAGHTHTLDTTALAAAVLAACVQKQEDAMTPEEKAALEKVQKSNDRLGKIVLLKAAARTHFDGLADEAAQDIFLAKSEVDQTAEVKKAADDAEAARLAEEANKAAADPVLHTTKDGIEIRKSDGAAALALAKARDEDRAEIADLKKNSATLAKAAETAEFEKRAAEELPHLPGTVPQRAALLKAAEGIEDEDTRKAAVAALKSQNAQNSPMFSFAGTVDGGDVAKAGDDPQTKLDALAKGIQEKNPGMSDAKAQAEALKTADGAALYGEIAKRDRAEAQRVH